MVAKPKASEPTTAAGRAWAGVRRILIGRPLATEEEVTERLRKLKALPIFSSDAISSSAYATEEILRVLVLAGAAALFWSMWVAAAIALMLVVVSTSYRQIGYAYPEGGGAYSVAKANLGRLASLIAAAALLVDYIMTVAVSTSSAVEQITSAIPALFDLRVGIAVVAIALIMLGNLRGLRESGNIFTLPTYMYVGSALLMIGLGVFQITVLHQGAQPHVALPPGQTVFEPLTIILLLHAFAGGSVALTGVEAIANGVPAFEPPEPRNAATTLTAMAILLGVIFIGVTFIADSYGILPGDTTVPAQVAATVFGPGSGLFFFFQASTALILFLACNTSFNAFPRLAAILARDGYMPRGLAFRGDRLAFTVGIAMLGGIAAVLIALVAGDTHALIPLYAVGVFVSFTISQAGMVRHWLGERGAHLAWHVGINAFGCALTGVVAVVVLFAKAPESLLVAIVIPLLVLLMLFIHREYAAQARELEVKPQAVIGPPHRRERVVVPVPALNRAVVQAVNFARSISDNVVCVHVTDDAEAAEELRERFARQLPGVPFVIVESPFRALVNPFIAYLDVTGAKDPEAITLVVLPEYVPRHWWDRILYNQVTNRLKRALLGRPNTVVSTVPYRREA